jgi:ATP-binding cassette subfamily B protein
MTDSPSDAPQKRKRQPLRPLARMWPYLRQYKGLVTGACIALIVAAATTLSLPTAVRRMIDHGFSDSDGQLINNYFSMLIVLAALLAAASAARYYFVITLGERVVSDVRRDVFAHVMTLSSSFFDNAMSGEIVSRLTADTTQIKSVVGATASVALRNIILCFGALAMMVYTSPSLSGIVIAAIPVIVLPMVAFGRKVRARSRKAQDTLADATAYASEAIGSVRSFQAFTNESLSTSRFAGAVELAFEAARTSAKARAGLTAFAIFLIFSSVVAVLWFGAQKVLIGSMSAGTLGQFLLYAVFAAGALGALSEVWGELQLAAGAAERLSELLDEEPAILSPANPVALPEPAEGAVALENVSFAYPTRPADSAVREPRASAIRPGETVAVAGPSGAGKSTLFALLLRQYDPSEGRILVDGVDLRDAALERGARAASPSFPQDVAIFSGTAADNIAFARARRDPRGRDRGGKGRAGARVHRGAAERLRYRSRRARCDPFRRPAPAHRHCPRHPARRARAAARRGHLGARCRKRETRPEGARTADGRPHHHRHRTPPRHHPQGRPHPRHAGWTNHRGRHACIARPSGERHLFAACKTAVRYGPRRYRGRRGGVDPFIPHPAKAAR